MRLIYQALHLAKSLPFTDTSMKMDALSVNLSEILAHCPKKKKSVPSWHEFSSLFSCVRGHERSLSHLAKKVRSRQTRGARVQSASDEESDQVNDCIRGYNHYKR